MKVMVAAVLAAASLTAGWAGATPASATAFCVVGTTNAGDCPAGSGPGGAFVMTATNTSTLAIAGSTTLSCAHATLSGTASASTTGGLLSIPVTLRYANCLWAGALTATVTPAAACDATGGSAVTLDVTGDTPTTFTTLTVPSGCTITASVPSIACAITLRGAQTIGNDTPGVGGQTWVDGTTAGSTDQIINNTLTTSSGGGGFTCPSSGTHAGTLSATYRVSTPATAPGVVAVDRIRWRSNKGVVYPTRTPFAGTITAENVAPVSFRIRTSVLTCPAGAMTLAGTMYGDATTKGSAGPVGSWIVAALVPLGTGCISSDDLSPYNIATCSIIQGTGFTAAVYPNAGDTYDATGTRVVSGSLTGIGCDLRDARGRLCGTVTGSMPLTYRNPSNPGGTLRPLRITAKPTDDALFTTPVPTGTNQNLTYTDTTRACTFSTASIDFGDDGFPQGGTTFRVTSSNAIRPVFWRGRL